MRSSVLVVLFSLLLLCKSSFAAQTSLVCNATVEGKQISATIKYDESAKPLEEVYFNGDSLMVWNLEGEDVIDIVINEEKPHPDYYGNAYYNWSWYINRLDGTVKIEHNIRVEKKLKANCTHACFKVIHESEGYGKCEKASRKL